MPKTARASGIHSNLQFRKVDAKRAEKILAERLPQVRKALAEVDQARIVSRDTLRLEVKI